MQRKNTSLEPASSSLPSSPTLTSREPLSSLSLAPVVVEGTWPRSTDTRICKHGLNSGQLPREPQSPQPPGELVLWCSGPSCPGILLNREVIKPEVSRAPSGKHYMPSHCCPSSVLQQHRTFALPRGSPGSCSYVSTPLPRCLLSTKECPIPRQPSTLHPYRQSVSPTNPDSFLERGVPVPLQVACMGAPL